jgi:hypothetical protein
VASTRAAGTEGGRRQPPGGPVPVRADPARRPTSDYWRHDPRVDPPTKKDRRRLLAWMGLLAFTPVCLGGVVWAALRLNGNYPTVAPPVPRGWQSVPGIYASFAAPRTWSIQQLMSDAAGDIYYSGPGGGAGESVTQASSAPRPANLPTIVATYLVDPYKVVSRTDYRIHNATDAWKYTFRLRGGRTGLGLLAWVAPTQSVVWLFVATAAATTEKLLSTLTLAA